MNLISFSDRLSKFLMVLAAVWAFGLTFMILADIIGRGVFDSPINGTAELASLAVTDPVAAAAKIGEGVKVVGGAMVAAPGEAAEAALKIGGKLGKLGANVGGEVVGELGKVGGEALKAGNAAGNAIKNIGGGIASGANKSLIQKFLHNIKFLPADE